MQKLSENTDSVKPLLRRFPARERTKFMGRLPSWLKNKYLLTGVFFAIWMVFFDQKDILSLFELRNKQNGLETSLAHQKQIISEAGKEQYLLKTSVQGIEKYARENFMMKKDNEDLFIIKPAPENK
jgi:cell division protein DivIC